MVTYIIVWLCYYIHDLHNYDQIKAGHLRTARSWYDHTNNFVTFSDLSDMTNNFVTFSDLSDMTQVTWLHVVTIYTASSTQEISNYICSIFDQLFHSFSCNNIILLECTNYAKLKFKKLFSKRIVLSHLLYCKLYILLRNICHWMSLKEVSEKTLSVVADLPAEVSEV